MIKQIDLLDKRKSTPLNPNYVVMRRDLSKIKQINVHTTDADWSIQQLINYDLGPNHLSPKGTPSITYHEVITKDDVSHVLVEPDIVTWNAAGHNKYSYAIALMYRASTNKPSINLSPPPGMVETLTARLIELCLILGLNPEDGVKGHRELKGTGFLLDRQGHKRLRKTCPGLAIDLDLLRKNTIIGLQEFFKPENIYRGKIDGLSGPLFREAIRIHKSFINSRAFSVRFKDYEDEDDKDD